jgi:large subunit ribosomal protein L32
MAVPKSKVSKARRDKRRNSHWKLDAPTLVACEKCGEPKQPHRVCSSCGTYGKKQVVQVNSVV